MAKYIRKKIINPKLNHQNLNIKRKVSNMVEKKSNSVVRNKLQSKAIIFDTTSLANLISTFQSLGFLESLFLSVNERLETNPLS